jgi:hypothetical protein
MDYLEDHICPACRKYFTTIKGVHSHLSSSRKCHWYKKGKLKEGKTIVEAEGIPDHTICSDVFQPCCILGMQNPTDICDEVDPQEAMEEIEDLFEFIPLPAAAANDSGPSSKNPKSHMDRWTSIHLNEDQESQYIDLPYPEAGYIIKVDESLHQKWRRQFGHLEVDQEGDVIMEEEGEALSPFAPFASELDWRLASWAVKDGIGHKSFDRLLSIPGVSIDN